MASTDWNNNKDDDIIYKERKPTCYFPGVLTVLYAISGPGFVRFLKLSLKLIIYMLYPQN